MLEISLWNAFSTYVLNPDEHTHDDHQAPTTTVQYRQSRLVLNGQAEERCRPDRGYEYRVEKCIGNSGIARMLKRVQDREQERDGVQTGRV
jgi:hypothetical protein